MPYKAEVQTGGTAWDGNALVFATEDEAVAYAKDLMSRWMLVTDYRAVECQDEVNYRWSDEGGAVALPVEPKEGFARDVNPQDEIDLLRERVEELEALVAEQRQDLNTAGLLGMLHIAFMQLVVKGLEYDTWDEETVAKVRKATAKIDEYLALVIAGDIIDVQVEGDVCSVIREATPEEAAAILGKEGDER